MCQLSITKCQQFWLIWFINQRACTIILCPSLLGSVSLSVSVSASALLSVYSPPSHMVRHRTFIFVVNMYTGPYYMHIKYLVILTYIFQMAAIFGTFYLICSPAYIDSHRNFIIGMNMYTCSYCMLITFFKSF